MKKLIIALLPILFLFIFGFTGLVSATVKECAESDVWAIDYNPYSPNYKQRLTGFTCARSGNGETKQDKTRIFKNICSNECGTCPSDTFCKCVRTADCHQIGGLCFKNNISFANVDSSLDGKSRSKLINGQKYTTQVLYRCPGDSKVTCYIPDPTPDTSGPIINPNDCAIGQVVSASGGPGRGGSAVTTHQINMADASGSAIINWDFGTDVSKLEIFDADSKQIVSTGSIAGKGTKAFNFQAASDVSKNYITVVVTSQAGQPKAIWEYQINCPGETPAFLQDTPGTSTLPGTSTSPGTTTNTDEGVVNISDCCREIAPKDSAYATGDYVLGHFVQVAINIYECILCIVGALMLLMFVLGGFMFMTSAGSSDRISTGKKMITGAIIGGIIVFSSILIVNFSVKALGGSFIDESNLRISPGK